MMSDSNSSPRSSTSTPARAGERQDIVFLSDPHGVSMAERYFDIVDLNHFWVVRRFEVMRRIAGQYLDPGLNFCEIGCGNGMLQRQLEMKAGLKVDGFELCLNALRHNQSEAGTLYYYNVFEQRPELQEKYDVIFLFDVLEHLEQDLSFLKACLFHLKKGGHLIMNVPARKELFSRYDVLAGHARRYILPELRALAASTGVTLESPTYWGLPLYPLLMSRKYLIERFSAESAYEKGFKPPNQAMNSFFRLLSRFETVPQRVLGTSIMGVLKKND